MRALLRPRALVVAAVFVWLFGAAASLGLAYEAFESGEEHAQDARAQLTLPAVKAARTETSLAAAARDFERGRRRLRSPLTAPLRVLPVVGRHLRATERLARAAGDVASTGAEATRAARKALAVEAHDGPARVALLATMERTLTVADRDLRSVDAGSPDALAGAIGSRIEQFDADLTDARDAVTKAKATVASARRLLEGPSTVLLLAANNAEMRAGSGMFLSAGVLRIENGAFDLGDMTPTGDLRLDQPVAVHPSLESMWGWLQPGREWRNLGITPDFPTTAELAGHMWAAGGGDPVDGVIAVDIDALRAVIEATGPISEGGIDVNSSTVVEYLMHDQYVEFDTPDVETGRAARRDRLGEIASAVVGRLQGGSFDAAELADGLAHAVGGRHLMMWTADADAQKGWVAANAAGDIGADDMVVAVQNRGGNKLDTFLGVEATADIERSSGSGTVTVTLTNATPEGEPAYIAGPYPGVDVPAGTYVGLLTAVLPGAVTDATIEGGGGLAVAGSDDSNVTVAAEVRIPRGESATYTVRWRQAVDRGTITVRPSARLPAVAWRHEAKRWTDDRAVEIRW